MTIRPQHLVRLFPRQWRRRYGDEFLAMVEQQPPLDSRVIFDSLRSAGAEWAFHTFTGRILMGLLVATLANVAAWYLISTVPLQADIQFLPDGHKLVGPPWPTHAVVSMWFIQWSFFARSIAGFFPRLRIGRFELVAWLAVLFCDSTVHQWSDVVAWLDTGITAPSRWNVWQTAASSVAGALAFSHMCGMFFDPRFQPARSPFRTQSGLGLSSGQP